jgi:hypothetical protein
MQFHVTEYDRGTFEVKLGRKTKKKLRKLRNGALFGIAIATAAALPHVRKSKNTDEQ